MVSLNLGECCYGFFIVAMVHTYPEFLKIPIMSKENTAPFSLFTDNDEPVEYFIGQSLRYGDTYYGLAKLTGQHKVHMKFNVESSYSKSTCVACIFL